MPHPKGNLKLSGDTHLPDAESELDVEEGSSGLADLAKDRHQPRGAAARVRRAGVLTSGEAQQQEPEARGGEGSVGAAGTDVAQGSVEQRAERRIEPRPIAIREIRTVRPWGWWALGLVGAAAVVRVLR